VVLHRTVLHRVPVVLVMLQAADSPTEVDYVAHFLWCDGGLCCFWYFQTGWIADAMVKTCWNMVDLGVFSHNVSLWIEVNQPYGIGYCIVFPCFIQFARFARFPGLIRVQDHVVRPGTPKIGHICGIAAGQPRSGGSILGMPVDGGHVVQSLWIESMKHAERYWGFHTLVTLDSEGSSLPSYVGQACCQNIRLKRRLTDLRMSKAKSDPETRFFS